MKITKINLNNFRAAKELEIELHQQMNLFIGVNGAGKTTILQAISSALIVLIRKFHNSGGNYKAIPIPDINQNEDQSVLEISLELDNTLYSWNIEQTRPGGITLIREDHAELNQLVNVLKKKYKQGASLPVIVYYPVDRTVEKNTLPMFRTGLQDDEIDIYSNALNGRPNFQNFFRWFRDQDDYINQKSLSRSHWIKRNGSVLRRRIVQIVENFKYIYSKDSAEISFNERFRPGDYNFFLKEPRFLFHELNMMLRSSSNEFPESDIYLKLLDEFDYMIHKMEMLPSDTSQFIKNAEELLAEILSKVIIEVSEIQKDNVDNERNLKNIMELFIFSLELGLWWLSDAGHSRLVHELSAVFWPNSRTDAVNSDIKYIKEEIINTVLRIIETDANRRSAAHQNYGKSIQNVVYAIEQFLPEFTNLRIDRKENGTAHMLVDKNDQEFDIGQLSGGERNLIALIGDIARRLTLANPASAEPLKEAGIVLIDEIDLHLHPKWQRIVSERITQVFPNCQFILTTHSPQVISHIKPECIVILKNLDGVISKHTAAESYGKSSDRILEDIMDETSRPKYIDDEIRLIFGLIRDGNSEEAMIKINKLRESIGEDSDLIKAGVLIKRKEIIGK